MTKPLTERAWDRFEQNPRCTLWIQASLPNFLHTLPILITIEGQGSEWQGSSPLASREEPDDA